MPELLGLHALISSGEADELRARLKVPIAVSDLEEFDRLGRTPLMVAVQDSRADCEIVRLLLDNGANVNQVSTSIEGPRSVLSLAVSAGDPEKVALLLEHGADIGYCREHGYTALIDSLYGRDIRHDSQLLVLIRLLISRGVELNAVTDYNESALRVLSRVGRFDAVRLLLDAGADESQLVWTQLIRAVALGTLEDVGREIVTTASMD